MASRIWFVLFLFSKIYLQFSRNRQSAFYKLLLRNTCSLPWSGRLIGQSVTKQFGKGPLGMRILSPWRTIEVCNRYGQKFKVNFQIVWTKVFFLKKNNNWIGFRSGKRFQWMSEADYVGVSMSIKVLDMVKNIMYDDVEVWYNAE